MCEVVCGINSPLISGAVVRLVQDSVGCEVPHLGVAVGHVLLHAKEGFLRRVLAVSHGPEFCEGFLDGTVVMSAGIARETFAFAALLLDFRIWWKGVSERVMMIGRCM